MTGFISISFERKVNRGQIKYIFICHYIYVFFNKDIHYIYRFFLSLYDVPSSNIGRFGDTAEALLK